MREKVILVGLDTRDKRLEFEESMDELEALAESAGAEVLARMVQVSERPDPRYYIGSGKALELKDMAGSLEADSLIFNNELSGSQIKNLEKLIGVKIVDRTNLILDIFAMRARTKEAVFQVKLAQAEYILPRLSGYNDKLSRQAGGIGTRGPGEQQLELDRRKIRGEISRLKDRLMKLSKNRDVNRRARTRSDLPVVSMLGYTNAGKSTLMNSFLDMASSESEKRVYADDRLFATLETSHRLIECDNHKSFILADTVGIIRDLPINLIEAFKSTLEDISYSDYILLVIDGSSKNLSRQMVAIKEIIEDLEIGHIPMIEVYNKRDLDSFDVLGVRGSISDSSITISARDEEDVGRLLDLIWKKINSSKVFCKVMIPYSQPALISRLIEKYSPDKVYADEGVFMDLYLSEGSDYEEIKKYEVAKGD